MTFPWYLLEVEVVLVLVLDSEFRCGDVEADGALVLVPQLPQGLHDELAALAVRSTSSIGHPPTVRPVSVCP